MSVFAGAETIRPGVGAGYTGIDHEVHLGRPTPGARIMRQDARFGFIPRTSMEGK